MEEVGFAEGETEDRKVWLQGISTINNNSLVYGMSTQKKIERSVLNF